MESSEILADISLARQLELTETIGCVNYAAAHHHLHPESRTASIALMGGFAIFSGVDSPITQAFGMGLHGAITGAEFDELESFYFERQTPVNIELCPLADQSMIDQLNARGYRVVEYSNVLYRRNDPAGAGPQNDIVVRRPSEAESELWTGVVSRGFAEVEDPEPSMLDIARTMFFTADSIPLLVEIDGSAAGGGAVSTRGKVANFYAHATAVEFRGRGAQSALIQSSFGVASRNGCDLVMAATLPGSTSQRNFERRGFRIAYTRTKFARDYQ